MNASLTQIKKLIYDKCDLQISFFKNERESKEYDACRYELNGLKIISRSAKITPKKIGQFVTFWKRDKNGPIEPFHKADSFDFYVINVRNSNWCGQFVFPKSILIEKGIITTDPKDGKRGFRVYPIWDKVQNKQAAKTQKWQIAYFYEINKSTAPRSVIDLYKLSI